MTTLQIFAQTSRDDLAKMITELSDKVDILRNSNQDYIIASELAELRAIIIATIAIYITGKAIKYIIKITKDASREKR